MSDIEHRHLAEVWSIHLVFDGKRAITLSRDRTIRVWEVGSVGNLYIADFGNNRVRKVFSAGIISTVAGSFLEGLRQGDTRYIVSLR